MREEMETFDYITSTIISRTSQSSHKLLRGIRVSENSGGEGQESEKVANLPKMNNPSVLRDITNIRFIEEEENEGEGGGGKSKCRNSRWKNEVARERWKILAKALLRPRKGPGRYSKMKDISVRRFASFDLVTPIMPGKLEKLEKRDGFWLKYGSKYFTNMYLIEIHHLEPKLTPKELIGFNNTGNICIWPSEEVLTYYLLSKIYAFEGKDVLEIGGGMTCLAGMMLAKYGNVKKIDLTDGNLISVENVKKIIWRNKLDKNKVASFQLDWVDHKHLKKKYDVVLSSDCLFFDETRSDLVETIWNSLGDGGVALVMAPKRGNTLNNFVQMAAEKGFYCVLLTYYEETVWKQHLKFKEFSQEYDEDLHYPILLLLTNSSQRTDYWVSQGRKFCEFCKCSIADNKPSIQFHENGKKHKENVAKRLTEMQKKAAKEAKDAVDFDREMKRMEAAALKAYMNDVKSNADYTSQQIQKGIETLPEPEQIEPEPCKPKPGGRKQEKKFEKKPPVVTKKWMEAVSENGLSYYWNVETGESVWEVPEVGYLSLAEQEKQKARKPAKGPPKSGKKHKKHGKFNPAKHKPKTVEKKADEKEDAKVDFGPIPYVPPFGKWKKVEPPKEQKIDLQLPQQEWVEITVPKLKEEGEKGFKQKTSTPGFISCSQGETVFKKRKIAVDAKRNMRQRLDDD